MSKGNYHRFPDGKVIGVDCNFYRELLAGKFGTGSRAGSRRRNSAAAMRGYARPR